MACGGSTMSEGRAKFTPAQGGSTQHGTDTEARYHKIFTNTIERDKTHLVSFCHFAVHLHDDPPVEVHGTVITAHVIAIIRVVCTVVLCGHEDGWSQAGSKGKMCGFGHCLALLNERLMVD